MSPDPTNCTSCLTLPIASTPEWSSPYSSNVRVIPLHTSFILKGRSHRIKSEACGINCRFTILHCRTYPLRSLPRQSYYCFLWDEDYSLDWYQIMSSRWVLLQLLGYVFEQGNGTHFCTASNPLIFNALKLSSLLLLVLATRRNPITWAATYSTKRFKC